jgi:hypothetical protein
MYPEILKQNDIFENRKADEYEKREKQRYEKSYGCTSCTSPSFDSYSLRRQG